MDVPETPEAVALWLLQIIIWRQNCPERTSVEWVLDTYAKCLRVARGGSSCRAICPRLH